MAIIQVSEKIIKKEYITLESYLKKDLCHSESDLYYYNGTVYKIFKKIYRLDRQKYIWILEKNNFSNCLNITDQLYQGDKFIGCVTIFDKDYKSFKDIVSKNTLDLYEANQILEVMLNVVNNLLEYNLAYMDSHIENIGLSNNNLLFTDLDGSWYKPYNSLINSSFLNIYFTYFSLLLGADFDAKRNHDDKNVVLNILKATDYSLKAMKDLVNNLTTMQLDSIKEDYYKYLKIP